jgi:hypothetical protein
VIPVLSFVQSAASDWMLTLRRWLRLRQLLKLLLWQTSLL